MYAIETELGRFVGADERAAKKLLRAAERKAAGEELRAGERRAIASLRARAGAFNVMNRILAGENCPCGWRYYSAGEKHACPVKVERSAAGCQPHSHITVRTEHGTTVLKEWFLTFLGSVMNGAGHDLLLFLEDMGHLRCISVGVCEGVYAYEDVYGVSPDWFLPPNREAD